MATNNNNNKSTKTSNITIKKVIVKCLNKLYEVDVDSNIFDDIYMEACTRVVDLYKTHKDFKITVIFEAFLKDKTNDPMEHFIYNSYFVLVNAALYDKAEKFRMEFKKNHGIDLKNESVKGEDKPKFNSTINNINKSYKKNDNTNYPNNFGISGDFINN